MFIKEISSNVVYISKSFDLVLRNPYVFVYGTYNLNAAIFINEKRQRNI